MTYVVCEPCVDCKYGDCAEVCPVECFYEGDDMLYINPDECIDCDACQPVCPVTAIFPEDEVPREWSDFIEKNANFDFTEETRRNSKESVTHGPKWDPTVAGE
ncbi:MAG: indolepyruvate ferredoxin oxidoreductase subunit alpha [bacterium]